MSGKEPLLVTPEEVEQLRQLLALTVTGARGIAVKRVGYHFALTFPADLLDALNAIAFSAKITDHVQFGTVRRWKYAFEEVRLKWDGTIETVVNGRKGTIAPEQNYALNLIEVLNVADGAGVQGNSVDESRQGFPAPFDLQPVGSTAKRPVVVQMGWMPELQQDGTTGYRPVFAYENSHDGACP